MTKWFLYVAAGAVGVGLVWFLRKYREEPPGVYRQQLRDFADRNPATLDLPPLRELRAVKDDVRNDVSRRVSRFKSRMQA